LLDYEDSDWVMEPEGHVFEGFALMVFMSQLEVPSNKNIHNAVKKAKQARFEHGEKP